MLSFARSRPGMRAPGSCHERRRCSVRASASGSSGRRALIGAGTAGAALALALPSWAVPSPANTAVLQRLKEYKGSSEVDANRLVRLKSARAQLDRVQTLVAAGEFLYAREQLRLGAISNLNRDLRAVANDLDGVSEEQEGAVKAGLLNLDGTLRERGQEKADKGDARKAVVMVAQALDSVIATVERNNPSLAE